MPGGGVIEGCTGVLGVLDGGTTAGNFVSRLRYSYDISLQMIIIAYTFTC